MLTQEAIRAFNAKLPKYLDIQALEVSWPEDGGTLGLALTLRPRDPGLRHTRIVLRAKGVQALRLFPEPIGLPQVGLLEMRDITDRGCEQLSYACTDTEHYQALSFYCADLEAELLMF